MNASEKRAALAGAVKDGNFVVAPGVYDMISAKVADGLGFRALYMTGYGVAASHLGLPDAGIASYADVVGRVRTIAGGTASPLICDADTGFGGLLNVRHTVQGYEDAGCSAIQLEDQEMPKKCGHTPGRRVVPIGRHAGEDQGRGGSAQRSQLPHRRAHRCAHEPRLRRGDSRGAKPSPTPAPT